MTIQGVPPELAHYYPGWIWDAQSVGALKSLLLFFDGFALLLPEDHFQAAVTHEAELAQPLQEAGLLHNFEPTTWLDADTAQIIRRAAILSRPEGSSPGSITSGHFSRSMSISTMHMASVAADFPTADRIVDEMLRLGTIIRRRPDLGPDMVDMPMRARAAVLLTLSLAAQTKVASHRIRLVGDLSQAAREQSDPLPQAGQALSRAERVGQILHQDILKVGVDLSEAPLDEILDYRREHGEAYRSYAQGLREFVGDLEAAEPIDRPRMLHERSESIADHAAKIRRARRAWGRPVTALAFAGAGAAWTLHQADIWGAVLGALGAAAGFAPPPKPQSPFTYLFETRRIS
ncbi:hypothetical protein [Streptomyces olivaceus]|uniref:hypothetical protein n=1 Tax=Streptomyces olivaceus TaxID=47716 RepID=UPI001CCC09DB|nr:hypothetical protein [Streptomyces olivaceus]MBZ6142477.1 hypothetical protein [Streptomyces olivaceus]MBZ6170154.1 hypothetical protein [Streptomyces olivaceus]